MSALLRLTALGLAVLGLAVLGLAVLGLAVLPLSMKFQEVFVGGKEGAI